MATLENEILKEDKNLEKWPKMNILRPKNVIYERIWPLSKFHFPACSTLNITNSILLIDKIDKMFPTAKLVQISPWLSSPATPPNWTKWNIPVLLSPRSCPRSICIIRNLSLPDLKVKTLWINKVPFSFHLIWVEWELFEIDWSRGL